MKLGTRIKKILEFKHLKQRDLARGIGASETLVCHWCKNQRTPRIDYIEKIANFLGLTLFELLGYSPLFNELLDAQKPTL